MVKKQMDQPPLPQAIKSAERVLDQIGERPFSGNKFRLVLDIPVEYAVMAAWMHYADNFHQDHSDRFPFSGQIEVSNPPVYAHRQAARAAFSRAIHQWFAGQHKSLEQYAHPLLFPRVPIDDDEIPF